MVIDDKLSYFFIIDLYWQFLIAEEDTGVKDTMAWKREIVKVQLMPDL